MKNKIIKNTLFIHSQYHNHYHHPNYSLIDTRYYTNYSKSFIKFSFFSFFVKKKRLLILGAELFSFNCLVISNKH